MKILFDMYPAKGHFNASLKLAKLLRDSGHKIYYCSILLNLSSFIEKHDFGFYGLSNDFKIQTNREKISCVIKEYDLLIHKISPDMVLLDQQHMNKYILYKKNNIQVCALQTMPATKKERNVPPFTSFFIPRNNILSVIYTEILWQKYFLQEFIQKQYYNIKHRDLLLKNLAIQSGVSLGEIDDNRCFSIHFKGVPELILSPAAFDFPRKEEKNRYFIGPLCDIVRDVKIVDERYIVIRDKIINQKKENPDMKFIYCSLGTITKEFFSKCDIFFRKIKKVCLKNSDYNIVISVGSHYEIERLVPLPKNMFIFSSLPQTDILRHVDMMITHGGMNSITECIYNEVPMLVYPLSLHWDQPGNSARVLYHGLGYRGRISRDAISVIERKISKVLDESDRIKNNLKKLKQKFELNNNSTQVVDIIENLKENDE